MARPDNMTTTTPIDPDGCICPTTYGAVEAICAVHGRWPSRTYTTPLSERTLREQNAELAETCRVLTELAQQLTNVLDAVHDEYGFSARYAQLTIEALDAAAELGITPQP